MPDPCFDPPDPNGWAAQWISAFLDREAADVVKQDSLVSSSLEEMMIDLFDDLRQAPSPGERAFAILEPHLRDVPLYRPKYAYGGILPKGFGATADRPPELLRDPHWRMHP